MLLREITKNLLVLLTAFVGTEIGSDSLAFAGFVPSVECELIK